MPSTIFDISVATIRILRIIFELVTIRLIQGGWFTLKIITLHLEKYMWDGSVFSIDASGHHCFIELLFIKIINWDSGR